MTTTEMYSRIILLLLATVLSAQMQASTTAATDSALTATQEHYNSCLPSDTLTTDAAQAADKTTFKPAQLIVPGTLIALGTLGAVSDWGEKADPIHKHHSPEWHKMKMLHPDKWIQFVPSVFGIGLNIAGVKSPYTRQERLLLRVTSLALSTSVAAALKYTVKEQRPNGEQHSFPSGHATTAFQGAELVRMEYGGWYGIAAYAMATGVAAERIVYDKHWIHDVVMGAGIGILSARASLWLLPLEKRLFARLLKKDKSAAIVPYYDATSNAFGGAVAMRF